MRSEFTPEINIGDHKAPRVFKRDRTKSITTVSTQRMMASSCTSMFYGDKQRNRGGFPSPPKPTQCTYAEKQHAVDPTSESEKRHRRGGFPPPSRQDTHSAEHSTFSASQVNGTQVPQKPRGGFGLPPSTVMPLEEAANKVTLKELKGNCARHKLAQLSRKVASYSYSVPEGGSCLFASAPGRSDPVGVVVFTVADSSMDKNVLEFQFVHQRYQGFGIGKKLLCKAMEVMSSHNKKDVYLEAAEQSVQFYRKFGFKECGDMIETAGPGSAIFHRIYPMVIHMDDFH